MEKPTRNRFTGRAVPVLFKKLTFSPYGGDGLADRIDFDDPRERVLAELRMERRALLSQLRGLRRLHCDRRSIASRLGAIEEKRQALRKLRRAMLALRFRCDDRLAWI